ncbi:MAG: winged helix-turn-helix domain-containing protein [Alteromonadaceae bacterium]|nr:winged helix-turn-helix domain-containing protein [Alteromonadaceae bacterium]
MSYVTLTNITRNQIIRDKDSKDELIQTLPLKTIAVLTQLAKKQGQVVSHDQLMNNVWHNRIVSPNSLQRCIVQLRKALGDDSKQQGIIKTHAKQGYSLELPVSLIIPSANQSTKNTIDSLELKSQSHDVSSDNVQISNHFNKSSQVHTHIKPKTQKSLKKGAILLVGLFLVIITVFKFLSPTPRNFDFNSLTPVTSSDNKEFYPSYSPDGKFIVFHRYDGLCANNIWAKEIATAREYQLTTGYGFYTNHSFTENGKKLAFMAKVVCEGKKVKNTCWNLMTIDFEQALKQKQQPTLTVSCEQGKLSDPVWLNNGNIVALNKQNQLWQIVKFMPGAPDYVPFYTSKAKNYYHLNYSAKLEKLIAIAINSNNDHVIDLIDQYGKLLSSHIIKFPEYLSIYKLIDPIIDPQKEQLLFSTGKRLLSLSFLGDVEQVGLLNHNNIANIKMNNNGNKIVAVQVQ